MKNPASKNNKTNTRKFEKFVLSNTKKKSVKGGNDPIGFEDIIIS